jgi:cytochrome P450
VRLNPAIHDEVQEALALELPSSAAWTEVDIHHALLRVVAMVSGRVFIGAELCRNEKYLDSAINYTMDVMAAQRAVQSVRPWLRPFLANKLPQVKKLDERIKEAQEFLRPVIDSRKQAPADSSPDDYDDMLSWLLKEQPNFPDSKSQNIAKAQLGLSFAAIHTTALTATNAQVTLISKPRGPKY